MPDPTFTDIVVPGAKAALDWAKKASPLKDCKKVSTLPLNDPHSTWQCCPLTLCTALGSAALGHERIPPERLQKGEDGPPLTHCRALEGA